MIYSFFNYSIIMALVAVYIYALICQDANVLHFTAATTEITFALSLVLFFCVECFLRKGKTSLTKPVHVYDRVLFSFLALVCVLTHVVIYLKYDAPRELISSVFNYKGPPNLSLFRMQTLLRSSSSWLFFMLSGVTHRTAK